MKDLTKNRWKFVLIPALIVIAGIVLYIVHGGFNFDVEFMGGIRMQVNMHTDFDNKEVADLIQEKTVDTVSAKVQTGDNPQVAVIKTPPVDETVKTEIFNALKDKYNLSDDDLLSVSSASASFGNEIQRKALLYTLLAFTAMDYITGVMCAVNDKTLSSEVGFRGICRKVMIFMLVGIANILDADVVGTGCVLRTAVIFFYISNEGVSLLENAAHLGLPVPEKIKTVLEQLHDRAEKEEK